MSAAWEGGAVRCVPAGAADLAPIRVLLRSVHLPADDIGGDHQTFVIVRAGDALAGCVGLERCGEDVLLRSLAVDPRHRGAGVGAALHRHALAEAERRGVRAVYLLTTTAADYFARAGFSRIDRASVPAAVAQSLEFRAICPASAVCMALVLR